jgi:hypothetical protein
MSNYPPPQYQPPYPPPYQPAQQNSTTAIISLIAGILGLVAFPIIGSIIAVITGHMAKNEIARSGGAIGGGGLATAGLILGYIGVGLTVLGLCGFGLFLGLPLCLGIFGALSTPNNHSMLLPLLLAA